MRLSLHGANPAEWLALRADVVPGAAAEAWRGMAQLHGWLREAGCGAPTAHLSPSPTQAHCIGKLPAGQRAEPGLTESFEFLWCPVANRIAELPIPRGSQVSRGIRQTLRNIKAAAEA